MHIVYKKGNLSTYFLNFRNQTWLENERARLQRICDTKGDRNKVFIKQYGTLYSFHKIKLKSLNFFYITMVESLKTA